MSPWREAAAAEEAAWWKACAVPHGGSALNRRAGTRGRGDAWGTYLSALAKAEERLKALRSYQSTNSGALPRWDGAGREGVLLEGGRRTIICVRLASTLASSSAPSAASAAPPSPSAPGPMVEGGTHDSG